MYYLKRKPKKKKKDTAPPLFERAGIKVRKKPDLKARLDREFSLYVRLRDSSGGYFRCISCGRTKPFAQADCGHYHSRRHMATRWDEDNAHAECRSCNRFRADHMIGYRENLVRKIGQMRFDKLAWKAAQTRRWTDFELQELIKYYKDQNARLRKEKGI